MKMKSNIINIAVFPSRTILFGKMLTDFIVIMILLIPILLLFYIGKPYKRGFYCNDESIRYPYLENTISSNLLFFYSISIPVFVICINELFIYRNIMMGFDLSTKLIFRNYCWQVYVQLVPFVFACLSSQLITDIAKYSIGRLRPHFIDVCNPEVNGIIINRFAECPLPDIYITDFSCTKDSGGTRLKDSRLSFMSGHTSFCAVTLIYLIFYIQLRIYWRNIGLLKQLVQYLLICLTLFTGFTRISDYKHHWSDVMIGLIQGTLVAIICVIFVSDLYKPRSSLVYKSTTNSNDNQSTSRANYESGV